MLQFAWWHDELKQHHTQPLHLIFLSISISLSLSLSLAWVELDIMVNERTSADRTNNHLSTSATYNLTFRRDINYSMLLISRCLGEDGEEGGGRR